MVSVEVSNRSGVDVDEEAAVAVARQVLVAEGLGDGELGLAFVAPGEMRKLKQEHLGIDEATDVLSFPIDGPEAGPDGLLGDVVVCPAVARRNAPDQAGTYEDELALLVVHGVLHVLGHDHPEDESRYGSPMWKRQERLLRTLGAA